LKQFIKSLVPPIILIILNRFKNKKYGWKGNYATWGKAQEAATGYDSDEIINKVRNSLLKVKNGDAVYERDSVVFNKIQYSWPYLSGLMLSSIKHGKLNVVDFGGSFGSSYFQNKKFLDEIDNVSWNIIEQKHFVDVGKKEFEDDRLKFYYTIAECLQYNQPNILLLSSVLQYIEKPYELLNEYLKYNFDYIILDRTPFSFHNKDEIKLQIVPPNIYEASYPCWFFNEDYLVNYFVSKGYKMIESFNALDGKCDEYYFKGMILRRVKNV